jgi:glycosyltransferase involved in cell wall biosynthesis
VRALVVSGIWPPDVGGPASHARELAAFLRERGDDVRVVVAADREPAREPYPVAWVSRALPKGVVHAAAAAAIAREARRADVVYTTGMFARTATACAAVRVPYVLKLTGDPAFERARWRGRVGGDVESFQEAGGDRALRRLRDLTVRRAAHVVCPSAFLRDLAVAWGVAAERISVLPNPAPVVDGVVPRPRDEDGLLLAFAGRLGPQKALEVALAAVERVEGATLLVAGEGDLRAQLEAEAGPHTRFLGPLVRADVLALFAGADATVLPSTWENFPHTVVESLAVGTPVIATRVGGVPEVVEDGVNGLLVEPGDVGGLAAAIGRFARDPGLRARLRDAARPSVARYAPDAVYGRIREILAGAAR